MAQRIRGTTDHFVYDVKQATERWWGAAQRVAEEAGAKATAVRNLAQHRLDLSAVRRKIGARCSELGKAVYPAHLAGEPNPLGSEPTVWLLAELDVLHQREDTLLHELAVTVGRKSVRADAHKEQRL